MMVEDKKSLILRGSCLVLLTAQTSLLILVMRHSLYRSNYIPSSAVVIVEVLKLALAFLLEMFTTSLPPSEVLFALRYDFRKNKSQVLALAVPAFLYAVQNNLSYFALARLSAVSFQVIQQLKILTTALMAVWLMGKRLTNRHWVALFFLTAGVISVQLANVSSASSLNSTQVSSAAAWMGFFALLVNSLSSGFAGIYFEKLIKYNTPLTKPMLKRTISTIIKLDKPLRSIWLQSIELGIFGLFFSVLMAAWNDGPLFLERGFFYGYDQLTWLVVLIQVCGGILVAMVVRYTDSILKAFATSASIVLSSIITFGFLRQEVSTLFIFGVIFVIISVYIYAKADRLQISMKRQ